MLFFLKIIWSITFYLLAIFIWDNNTSFLYLSGSFAAFSMNRIIFSKQSFQFVDMLCLYRQVCLLGEPSCRINFCSKAMRKNSHCSCLKHSNTSGHCAKQTFLVLKILEAIKKKISMFCHQPSLITFILVKLMFSPSKKM